MSAVQTNFFDQIADQGVHVSFIQWNLLEKGISPLVGIMVIDYECWRWFRRNLRQS